MSFLLDEYSLKAYIDNIVAILTDANQLKEYRNEMSRAKRLILHGVQVHIVSHIATKGTDKRNVGCSHHVVLGYF